MKQQILRFGPRREMLGVLTESDRGNRFGSLALLVWNTGISHHIGPHRLNVELASAMSDIGLPVFRFDLSGRGDSQPRQGQGFSVVADVSEAMNALEALGYRRFILHGLCSGAIEAHYTAHADPRVVGLSMVDTYAYRVGSYYWHYFAKRVFHLGLWLQLVRRFGKDPGVLSEGDQFFVPFPSLERVRSDFLDFQRRNIKCHFTYSGGYDYIFNHPSQLQAMFPGLALPSFVALAHFPEADHLFTLVEHRRRLLETLSHWVLQSFSVAEESPEKALAQIDLKSE